MFKMKYISLIVVLLCMSGLSAQGQSESAVSGKAKEKEQERTKNVSPNQKSRAVQQELEDDRVDELDNVNSRMSLGKDASGVEQDKYLLDLKTEGFRSYDSDGLKSAYEMSSNKLDLMDEMMGDAEIRGDVSSKKDFARKIKNSGKYSGYKYEYAKNLLNSIDQNGFLICNGEIDTYPLYVLQELQSVRKDVKVINLKLIENDAYWKRISNTYGLKGNYSSSYKQFVSNLMQSNPDKKLYLSLNNRHDVLKHHKSNLYLTGLAFRLSKVAIKNQKVLESNWNTFELSRFKSKSKTSVDKKLDYSYIMILHNLYMFHGSGNQKLADEYKSLAKSVAENNGVWNKVKSKFE